MRKHSNLRQCAAEIVQRTENQVKTETFTPTYLHVLVHCRSVTWCCVCLLKMSPLELSHDNSFLTSMQHGVYHGPVSATEQSVRHKPVYCQNCWTYVSWCNHYHHGSLGTPTFQTPKILVKYQAVTPKQNHATGYASQHIWCLSQARIKWEGCCRKDIWRKNRGCWRWVTD